MKVRSEIPTAENTTNMDENDLTELMMSMMGKEDASCDNNLK